MVGIVDGAIVLFHVWHQIVNEVKTEYILAKHGLRHTSQAHAWWGGQQLEGITIRQHHNHLLCLAFSQQVVEDIVDATYFVINLLRIGGTTNQVEYGVLFVLVLLVLRGQINHSLIGSTQTLGVIMDILQFAMGDVENIVG